MKKLRITIEGKTYEVLVEALDAPASAAAPAPAPVAAKVSAPVAAAAAPVAKPATPAPAAAGAGDIGSPLAGKIVALKVTVGQAVKAGDELVTVEAMKMNTPVNAVHDGKVEAIYVAVGDAVGEGQALVKVA